MDHVNETAFPFSGPPYPGYFIALRGTAPFIAGHGFIPQDGSKIPIDHYIPIRWDVQKRLVQPTESSSYSFAHWWGSSEKFRPGHAKSFGHRTAHDWLPLQFALSVSITPGRVAQDLQTQLKPKLGQIRTTIAVIGHLRFDTHGNSWSNLASSWI